MNRVLRGGLALATTAALAATAACGGGDEGGGSAPGVTDNEILIGSHQPLTGPAAPGYSKISAASKAYFEYVNDNGGVHGRKINYKVVDDTYNPSTTQQVVRELVLKDKVFAIFNGLGTPTHTGVLDFLKTNRVPDLFVASGSRSWNQPEKYPTTFAWQSDYTVEAKILSTYVQKNLAGKKVCTFGQNDDFGRDGVVGVEQVLGKDKIVARQTYASTNTNVAPQIGALKAAGCEVVMLFTIPGFTALSLGTAARLGFRPQWVTTSVGADYATVSGLLGKGAPLLEGLISVGYLPASQDTSNPWTALFRKINTQYNSNAPYDGNVQFGMAVAYTFVQALKAAGENPTREKIMEVIEKNDLGPNPGVVPFRYTSSDHSGYSGGQIAVVKDKKQLGTGAIFTTDDGDGPVKEYTGTPSTPPSKGIPE